MLAQLLNLGPQILGYSIIGKQRLLCSAKLVLEVLALLHLNTEMSFQTHVLTNHHFKLVLVVLSPVGTPRLSPA